MIPYMNDLVRIRTALEQAELKECPYFPEHGCDIAMVAVKQILGLKAVRGQYTPLEEAHNWNHDTDLGMFVDLTLDQFEGVDQPIVLLPDTTKLLIIDQEKTAHLPSTFHTYEDILEPFYRVYRSL